MCKCLVEDRAWAVEGLIEGSVLGALCVCVLGGVQ